MKDLGRHVHDEYVFFVRSCLGAEVVPGGSPLVSKEHVHDEYGYSCYICIPGKQVAVNFHQRYPKNKPQLPKKRYTMFSRYVYIHMW